VQRVEDHIGLLVGTPMTSDDLRCATDDHLVDIATDLNVVVRTRLPPPQIFAAAIVVLS
jgi:hypothetical protein